MELPYSHSFLESNILLNSLNGELLLFSFLIFSELIFIFLFYINLINTIDIILLIINYVNLYLNFSNAKGPPIWQPFAFELRLFLNFLKNPVTFSPRSFRLYSSLKSASISSKISFKSLLAIVISAMASCLLKQNKMVASCSNKEIS